MSARSMNMAKFWDHHIQKVGSQAEDAVNLATDLLSIKNYTYFAWLDFRDPDFTAEWPHVK